MTCRIWFMFVFFYTVRRDDPVSIIDLCHPRAALRGTVRYGSRSNASPRVPAQKWWLGTQNVSESLYLQIPLPSSLHLQLSYRPDRLLPLRSSERPRRMLLWLPGLSHREGASTTRVWRDAGRSEDLCAHPWRLSLPSCAVFGGWSHRELPSAAGS